MIEEKFIQLVEDKSAYSSQGKRKIGRNKYTSLCNTYNVLSYGGVLPMYNYIFCIATIKVVSLMYRIQEKLQFKAGFLRNVTIAGHKFKNIPVYERGGKGLRSLFN